jgi:membrane associated rhomboid family serine protease
MNQASRMWLALCALHGVASMLMWWASDGWVSALTWRADGWLQQPWTLWTSPWVHMNTPHLIGNQVALGALTALAWAIRPTRACALAWLLAWPLIQLSLPLWPQIGYAVGLSGLLHAGAMVLAVQLLVKRIVVPKARRWGGLLALAVLGKLVLESGWTYPVVWDGGNEMSVVQAAHLAGAFWGAVLGLALGRRQRSPAVSMSPAPAVR